MVKDMTDIDAAKYYEDPANLKLGKRLAGPSLARSGLNEHVPVRFTAAVVAQVKTLAAEDGVSVSSWIRRLVMLEIERRSTPVTRPSAYSPGWLTVEPTPEETRGYATGRLISA
jgi:hypothetical protein